MQDDKRHQPTSKSELESKEIARRRDEIVRQMANTPPKPHKKLSARATKGDPRADQGD